MGAVGGGLRQCGGGYLSAIRLRGDGEPWGALGGACEVRRPCSFDRTPPSSPWIGHIGDPSINGWVLAVFLNERTVQPEQARW